MNIIEDKASEIIGNSNLHQTFKRNADFFFFNHIEWFKVGT